MALITATTTLPEIPCTEKAETRALGLKLRDDAYANSDPALVDATKEKVRQLLYIHDGHLPPNETADARAILGPWFDFICKHRLMALDDVFYETQRDQDMFQTHGNIDTLSIGVDAPGTENHVLPDFQAPDFKLSHLQTNKSLIENDSPDYSNQNRRKEYHRKANQVRKGRAHQLWRENDNAKIWTLSDIENEVISPGDMFESRLDVLLKECAMAERDRSQYVTEKMNRSDLRLRCKAYKAECTFRSFYQVDLGLDEQVENAGRWICRKRIEHNCPREEEHTSKARYSDHAYEVKQLVPVVMTAVALDPDVKPAGLRPFLQPYLRKTPTCNFVARVKRAAQDRLKGGSTSTMKKSGMSEIEKKKKFSIRTNQLDVADAQHSTFGLTKLSMLSTGLAAEQQLDEDVLIADINPSSTGLNEMSVEDILSDSSQLPQPTSISDEDLRRLETEVFRFE